MMQSIVRSQQRGFTLIELLVVIAVIGVLSALIFSSLDLARAKAFNASTEQQIREYMSALELYVASTGGYPYGGGIVTDYCLGDYPDDACGFDGNSFFENSTLNAEIGIYIPKLPMVGSGPVPIHHPSYSFAEGAIYRCTAVISGSLCSHYRIAWILKGADVACAFQASPFRGIDYTICTYDH